MAFSDAEIRDSHVEDIKREKFIHNDDTRAGLQRVARDRGINSGSHSFKRISLRDVPDFTADDWQTRIVVVQTAYSHFRVGPWKRAPETLLVDLPRLTVEMVTRLERYVGKQPRWLTRFNTSKDYIACLLACAYLFWRLRWKMKDIAGYLEISVLTVRELIARLRYNATRLGMPIKRTQRFRGLPVPRTREQWLASLAAASAKPEVRQRRSAAMKRAMNTSEGKAAQSQRAKKQWDMKFLKTVAWG
jgi:hypothetical protein